ncbi:hypothetical protein ZWY2020_059223 [Hordeum vulgare]|nr:hypothetical protein ZWY2020_059223 [Hordeum vulgare]
MVGQMFTHLLAPTHVGDAIEAPSASARDFLTARRRWRRRLEFSDVMASLETPVVRAPVSTELAESAAAEPRLRRVRLWPCIVSGWEASVQDDVAEVTPATPMKKLENIAKVTPTMKKLPQPKAAVGQKQDVSANPNTETKRPPKLAGESLAKKTLKSSKASDPRLLGW